MDGVLRKAYGESLARHDSKHLVAAEADGPRPA